MANGYFERGEMYDILFGDALAGEMVAHRPGIIVSSDRGNKCNPTVLMIYSTTTTTPNKQISVNHKFVMNGWTNYALCNQFVTVNKNRLKKFYGKLSDYDMGEIENCILESLDISCVDETALKEKDSEIKDRDVLIGDLQTEVAGVKTEIAKKDEEIASLKMENEMWQKCYGRCMDMLVDTKVNGDLARRTVAPSVEQDVGLIPEPPKQPEPPKEEPVVEDRLDINKCTATALKKVGFSLAVARKIVESRPFTSVEDLKRVNGVKASLYRILEPKLCCTNVKKVVVNGGVPDPGYEEDDIVSEAEEVQKVNVNTASAKEIREVLGVSMSTCYSITGYRKKHGPYEKLEDLLNVTNICPGTLQRYGHLLEV